MRYKPFPLFEKLNAIFGRDRANGKFAQGAEDVVEEVEDERDVGIESRDGGNNMKDTEGIQLQPPLAPVANDGSTSKRKGAKNEDAMDKLIQAMDRGNECLKEFTRVMEHNFSSEKRLFEDTRNVANELRSMDCPSLTSLGHNG